MQQRVRKKRSDRKLQVASTIPISLYVMIEDFASICGGVPIGEIGVSICEEGLRFWKVVQILGKTFRFNYDWSINSTLWGDLDRSPYDYHWDRSMKTRPIYMRFPMKLADGHLKPLANALDCKLAPAVGLLLDVSFLTEEVLANVMYKNGVHPNQLDDESWEKYQRILMYVARHNPYREKTSHSTFILSLQKLHHTARALGTAFQGYLSQKKEGVDTGYKSQ